MQRFYQKYILRTSKINTILKNILWKNLYDKKDLLHL